MAQCYEFDKINDLVEDNYNVPNLFDVSRWTLFDISIDILPKPGGRCTIYCTNEYPYEYPTWTVKIGDQLLKDLCLDMQAKTVPEAFVCCAFAVVKHLGVEMPPWIIQLGSKFYDRLKSRYPGDAVVSLFF